MRKGASWIGGMVLGVALVVSCGTSMNHAMTSMVDMLGIDGLVSKDGPGDGDGSGVGDAKAAPNDCTPDQSFCDGAKVYTCTRSGQDALFLSDCSKAYPSTTNPGQCVTTGCNGGATACCAPEKPALAWNITTPFSSSGTEIPNTGSPGGGYFFSDCGQVQAYVSTSNPNPPGCATFSTNENVSINLARAGMFTVGQTITLPNANANVYVTQYNTNGTSTSCSLFSGSVTWVSDFPSAKVSFNVTCTTTGTSLATTGDIESYK